MITELRNASLEELNRVLAMQQDAKLDIVAPSSAMRFENGLLLVDGAGTPENVDDALAGKRPVGKFRVSEIMLGHLAEKFRVPFQYLQRTHDERPDLFDANLNSWLHGEHVRTTAPTYDPDGRRFLLRSFVPGEGDDGIGTGRALMSNRFGMIDYYDPLIAFLKAVMEADPMTEVVSTDLSDRRCVVRVASPSISMAAPGLLAGYRSPITPRWAPRNRSERQVGDIVYAGMKFANSEVGHGAYVLVPEIRVLACTNGQTITKDAMRRTHLGAQLAEGVIEWSAETRRKNVELVGSMTRDAVKSFISQAYLESTIADLEKRAGIELPDPAKTIEVVGKQLSFPEDVRKLVLDHFIRGGQVTAGGVLQAVTSAAQVVSDPNLAYDMEEKAIQAMDLAVTVR